MKDCSRPCSAKVIFFFSTTASSQGHQLISVQQATAKSTGWRLPPISKAETTKTVASDGCTRSPRRSARAPGRNGRTAPSAKQSRRLELGTLARSYRGKSSSSSSNRVSASALGGPRYPSGWEYGSQIVRLRQPGSGLPSFNTNPLFSCLECARRWHEVLKPNINRDRWSLLDVSTAVPPCGVVNAL